MWLLVLLLGESYGWCKSSYDKLASLGCWSLALSREPRLLLDAPKAPIEIGGVRVHKAKSTTRAEQRWQWSFWASIKVQLLSKEQDPPTSSAQWHWAPSHLPVDCRAEKPHLLWVDSHYSVLWKHISVRAVGSLLSIPGWYRKLKFLACRFVLKSLWPWHWESSSLQPICWLMNWSRFHISD